MGKHGVHTYAMRWARERLRSPEIARVPEGSVLRRLYNGEVHEVWSRPGYWEYNDQVFPTLYQVVLEITGGNERGRHDDKTKSRRTSDYSAVKFFGL